VECSLKEFIQTEKQPIMFLDWNKQNGGSPCLLVIDLNK